MNKIIGAITTVVMFFTSLFGLGGAGPTSAVLNQRDHWTRRGWPADIGGVYIDQTIDGDEWGLLLVNPTPQRMRELRRQIHRDLRITPADFSYRELRAIADEIAAEAIPGSMIYAVDVDCMVNGHVCPCVIRAGLSGSHVRVIVNVDARMLEHYRVEFAIRFGERVHVKSIAHTPTSYWRVHWYDHGWPDDIHEVHTNYILVVNPTPQREQELRNLLGDHMEIIPAAYSRNALYHAHREIVERIMAANGSSQIFSVGIGVRVDSDSNLVWFGQSGREVRVIVTVDEAVYEHYSALFAELYGGIVIVEIGQPIRIGF
ncbi:MAG: hypothetical protein FWE40_02130 [Oscillospiraceae bacterium]|nr:hypothetical protein [Oscillospiraceae bacterium]